MGLEHDQSHSLPEKQPEVDLCPDSPDREHGQWNSRENVKDETVLAQFGKRQQLRVSLRGLLAGVSRENILLLNHHA